MKQEDAQSPSAKHPALARLAENGASTSSLVTEEEASSANTEEADAGIAAVVERTLQQAVVSRCMSYLSARCPTDSLKSLAWCLEVSWCGIAMRQTICPTDT